MSAETLRRAAALMRERAEAATPGPWERVGDDLGMPGDLLCLTTTRDVTANAEHIASWHPAVALAVADWLDYEANIHEASVRNAAPADHRLNSRALTVARAYLGDAS